MRAKGRWEWKYKKNRFSSKVDRFTSRPKWSFCQRKCFVFP